MFTIRKATTEDIPLIHKMAQEVFPATYADILSRSEEHTSELQHNNQSRMPSSA